MAVWGMKGAENAQKLKHLFMLTLHLLFKFLFLDSLNDKRFTPFLQLASLHWFLEWIEIM